MKKIIGGLLSLSLFLMYSCSDPTGIGESLLPEGSLFDVKDTVLNIKLKTVREDSIRTDSLGSYLLGYLKDEPDFGTTKASIFTQVRLPFNNINFDDDIIYDSLVLHLTYGFSYGDNMARQTVKVHTLEQGINQNEDHYNYDDFEYDATPVGMLENYQHKTNDTIVFTRPLFLGEDTVSNEELKLIPQLSIKLADNLGEMFFNEILSNTDEENEDNSFDDNNLFLQFFNGFFITVDEATSDDNLLISYNLAGSANSRLALYYHTETQGYVYGDTINGVVDSALVTNYSYPTQPLNFVINTAAESINQITNNYSNTNANSAINNAENDIAYCIGMGGLNIEVEIDGIDSNFFEGIALHKATLQLEEAEANSFERYFVPPIFFTSTINDDGDFVPIEDYALQVASSNIYQAGGFVTKEDSLSNNAYMINCTNFIQSYVENEISGPLILTPSANWLTVFNTQAFSVPLNSRYFIPSRVKLANGGNNSSTKLVLQYSKVTN